MPEKSATPSPSSAAAASRRRTRRVAAGAALFSIIVGAALLLLWAMALLGPEQSEAERALQLKRGMHEAVSSLGEVMAALLGLSLTVVAIVVQLASARYPAKIVDLFMRDPVNLSIFGLMTSACVYVVLAPALTVAETMPWAVSLTGLALTVLTLGALLPYFGHVFAFLEPNNIITRIQQRAYGALRRAQKHEALDSERLGALQGEVAQALESIADNAMAAIGQSDRNLSVHTVITLQHFLERYVPLKPSLPSGWGRASDEHLSTLSKEFLDDIIADRTWVEAKVLMEFERIFRKSLDEMTELVSQVASSTRVIGLTALIARDWETRGLTVQFFNTYIRHALNARNVRAAYNVLYEYRQFASHLLRRDAAACVRVVKHLVYYGRTANAMNLAFVTVTVAHDVRVLCEEAFDHHGFDMSEMLRLFLTLDQPSEDSGGEVALLGVRRAQSILGAFFLSREDAALAEQIRFDMRDEPAARLRKIRDDILVVDERKFWEVTDRGFNFDWVPDAMRHHITEFFAPMLQDHHAEEQF